VKSNLVKNELEDAAFKKLIKQIIENQKYPKNEIEYLKFIVDESPAPGKLLWAVIGAYHYGLMQGVRRERLKMQHKMQHERI
jgi:hypothetical protein